MATLQQAIDAIQDLMGALTGMRSAPDEPPEDMSVFPFCVAYASDGTWGGFGGAGGKKGLHTIIVEVHIQRSDLPRDVAAAMAYSESVANALIGDPTLAGTVDTIVGDITYTFGGLGWAQAPGSLPNTIGWRFQLVVKQQSAIT